MRANGIKKLFWQSDIVIESDPYDLLIPLPANADACIQKYAGIIDFETNESDEAIDAWETNFMQILKRLIGDNSYSIRTENPLETGKEVKMIKTPFLKNGLLRVFSFIQGSNKKETTPNINDILSILHYNDHLRVRILLLDKKEIIFTQGHEIFWLKNFSLSEKTVRYLELPFEKGILKNVVNNLF